MIDGQEDDLLEVKLDEAAGKKEKEPDKKDDVQVLEKEPEQKSKKKEAVSAEEGIKKLQDKLRDETQAKLDAQRRESVARAEADAAKAEVATSQKSTLDIAIEAAKASKASLKEKYKAALAAGDFDAAGDLQEEMADIAAKLNTMESGKVELNARIASKPKPVVTDAAEAFAVNLANNNAPRSADWIRKHPDLVTNSAKYAKMMSAHYASEAEGIKAETPEYFAYLEKNLGLNEVEEEQEEEESALSEAAGKAERRASPPAAPTSRNISSNGTKPNTVTLSREEREMADNAGMSYAEWGRNKLKLAQEGKLKLN